MKIGRIRVRYFVVMVMVLIANVYMLRDKYSKTGGRIFHLFFTLLIGIITLSFFITCYSKNKIINNDFPYVISISDKKIKNYCFEDSLTKYIEYDRKNYEIENIVSYYSFLSNLYAMNQDSFNAARVIKKGIRADSEEVCKSFIFPMCNYINQERPGRTKSIPPFLHTNFSLFISVLNSCGTSTCIMSTEDIGENLELFLKLKYISLFDQWYRIPERKMDSIAQDSYDIYCRKELNQLYPLLLSNRNVLEIQSIIYVILLHSDDCEWSKSWLIRYYELFKESKFIDDHLKHFIRRSECIDYLNTREIVNSYIIE